MKSGRRPAIPSVDKYVSTLHTGQMIRPESSRHSRHERQNEWKQTRAFGLIKPPAHELQRALCSLGINSTSGEFDEPMLLVGVPDDNVGELIEETDQQIQKRTNSNVALRQDVKILVITHTRSCPTNV